MKKLNYFMALATIGILLFAFSCKKEGPIGPAGTNGTNGTNGIAGANGTDGKDGSVVSAADQASYNAANANNGGLYYNKFWVNPSDGATPATVNTFITGNADFFRCKSCHGWDLLGLNGQYISRGSTATRPNIAPNNLNAYAETHNIKQIFDAVKHTGGRSEGLGKTEGTGSVNSLNSTMPDYGLLMTDAQIWDIVKFLKEKRINSDKFYDLKTTGIYPTGTYVLENLGKNGNATAGKTYYTSECSRCHGADGKLNIPSAKEPIGYLARNKAAEMNHLIRFGLPGKSMFSGSFVHTVTDAELLNLNKALADTVAFPN